jgi:predicted RNase H-like nuclease (RuvC/YqgF family)
LNQPSLKDLVIGQAKINENLNKKMMSSDKILENIKSQIESLSSVVKNQLSFNKMIETQIAQVAAAMLDNGETLRQLKNSFENVKAMTMRGGKTTRDPPHPNHAAER